MKAMADALDKIPREEVEESADESEVAELEDADAMEAEREDHPEEDDSGPSIAKKS
jgi:hypothetical protein